MEIWRQTLSVAIVFALLGALLWTLRKARLCGGGSLLQRSAGTKHAAVQSRLLRGWWLRGARNPVESQAPPLETIAQVALTPQHALYWVRAGDRDLLVATHPQGCSLLTKARVMHPAPQELAV